MELMKIHVIKETGSNLLECIDRQLIQIFKLCFNIKDKMDFNNVNFNEIREFIRKEIGK